MIDYLNEIRIELMVFGIQLLHAKLGRELRNGDFLPPTIAQVADFMEEWQQERDIQEVDAWLRAKGIAKVFRKYKSEEALWLHYFQWFFYNSWDAVPSFLPTDNDWAIYYAIRSDGLKGCPNFGLALERATKVMEIKGETARQLSEISSKFR